MQKTFAEKSFISNTDNLNVKYKRDFLTNYKADKYYKILDNLLCSIEKDKRVNIGYGSNDICNIYDGTLCWDDDDIVCQIIRVMKHKVETFTGLRFNFVLINRYPNGNIGIGAHRDKEENLGDSPSIAGISLGSMRDIIFEANYFIPQEYPKKIELSLDHGSVYVMYHPTNKYWTHEIPKRTKIFKSRISLTFRYLYHLDERNKIKMLE